MTCLSSHLLRKHYEWIDGPATRKDKHATRRELADQEWYDMDASLTTLVYAFHNRMRALVRGWRSQKIDVGLQIDTFAGGVYEGWYRAVSWVRLLDWEHKFTHFHITQYTTDAKIKELLEGDDEYEEDDDESEDNASDTASAEPTPVRSNFLSICTHIGHGH
jgi:hypothetical protein